MAKLILVTKKKTAANLKEKAKRMRKRATEPRALEFRGQLKAIHFLRGLYSHSIFAIPALYLFHGAIAHTDEPCAIEGYPGFVFRKSTELSSINTISLSCRKVFDDDGNGLTGEAFSNASDETLVEVATYWSEDCGNSSTDALRALKFLRKLFKKSCKKVNKSLEESESNLTNRIGLFKQHANHVAAHMSLEPYEFDVIDAAHIVAVLAVAGEIVRSFDDHSESNRYFDEIDQASFNAAKKLFPNLPSIRLLQEIDISTYARKCWEGDTERELNILINDLPTVLGWN